MQEHEQQALRTEVQGARTVAEVALAQRRGEEAQHRHQQAGEGRLALASLAAQQLRQQARVRHERKEGVGDAREQARRQGGQRVTARELKVSRAKCRQLEPT